MSYLQSYKHTLSPPSRIDERKGTLRVRIVVDKHEVFDPNSISCVFDPDRTRRDTLVEIDTGVYLSVLGAKQSAHVPGKTALPVAKDAVKTFYSTYNLSTMCSDFSAKISYDDGGGGGVVDAGVHRLKRFVEGAKPTAGYGYYFGTALNTKTYVFAQNVKIRNRVYAFEFTNMRAGIEWASLSWIAFDRLIITAL